MTACDLSPDVAGAPKSAPRKALYHSLHELPAACDLLPDAAGAPALAPPEGLVSLTARTPVPQVRRIGSPWLASDKPPDSRPCRRTDHLRPYPNRSFLQAVHYRTSGQSRPRLSAPPPLPRKENPRSRAPNCSSEGDRSTTYFCLYNIYYYNNPSGRWPHYLPTRDLFPES